MLYIPFKFFLTNINLNDLGELLDSNEVIRRNVSIIAQDNRVFYFLCVVRVKKRRMRLRQYLHCYATPDCHSAVNKFTIILRIVVQHVTRVFCDDKITMHVRVLKKFR